MSKLYAIRQTGKSNYWYDFVEDFTSSELDRNCISNNFAYVKECQNNLGDLNPAWKNSEIVEFRELGEKDDFEDLYYKSLEQRADLEAKLAEKDAELKNIVEGLWTRKWANKYYEMRRKEQPKLLFPDSDEVYERYFELKQQIAKKEVDLLALDTENYSFKQQIDNLRQQLAEKEKEIEDMKHFKITIGTMETNQVDISSTTYADQDKISFCIEQLEKVKEKIQEDSESLINYNNASEVLMADAFLCDCKNFIDNQIKQLKEGK